MDESMEINMMNILLKKLTVDGEESVHYDKEKQHTTLDELPDDLIVDILVRSWDDKHLSRSKLVSKKWYFFISNLCLPKISPPSPFAQDQISGFIFFVFNCSGRNKISLKFFENSDERTNKMYFMYKYFDMLRDDGDDIKLINPKEFLACCNGLFLLASTSDALGIPFPCTQYSICNPYTRQFIKLSVNPNHKISEPCYASLAFDPNNSLNYRVIRESYSVYVATSVSSPLILDIFWSEIGTWSTHFVPLDPRVYNGFKWISPSVYSNGVLYLLSRAKFLIRINLLKAETNLKGSALELPSRDIITDKKGTIGISLGNLCYSICIEFKMLIWTLDNISSWWVLKHNINMCSHMDANPDDSEFEFKIYAFHPYSDEVFIGTQNDMIRFHLQSQKTVDLFYIQQELCIMWGDYFVFPYARCPAIIDSKVFRCTNSDPHNSS